MSEAGSIAREPEPKEVLRSPALLLATWFGTGLVPRAPGTVGSVAALPCCVMALLYLPPWAVLVTAGVLLCLGSWAAAVAGQRWGQVDHGAIVIDEVLGQLIAVALPFYVLTPEAVGLGFWLLGLALFRAFDIAKPWPVSYFDQHMKSALGVMLDDVAAGIGAGLLAIAMWLAWAAV